MKFEIKRRWTLDILFECDADSLKIAVEMAVEKRANLDGANLTRANLDGANLYGANLDHANLDGANLYGANLDHANLYGANLDGANLTRANLDGANLYGANLDHANLDGANLYGANLARANLYGANLYGANLDHANLDGANLTRANLYGAKGVNPYVCTPLLMLLEQPGPIRAYKIVSANDEGIYNGGLKYVVGASLEVSNADTNVGHDCGPGISLATLDWCMRVWVSGYKIRVCEFEAKDIAAIPTATDGKFRVHRCTVVGEKDLKEIGLVKSESGEPGA